MALAAYVLVKTVSGKAFDVVKEVKKIQGIKTAHTVAGPVDLILFVTSNNMNTLGKLITGKIQAIEGVRSTMTCIVA